MITEFCQAWDRQIRVTDWGQQQFIFIYLFNYYLSLSLLNDGQVIE
jgi:hypothetical protein